MEKYIYRTNNYEETQKLAESLAKYLLPGNLITLEGELGSGKTTFTQGLAKGLGVNQVVNSPTFTIIKEYAGRYPLYHMDVYRLEGGVEDLGFEDYFFGDGITIVEWPSIIKEYIPNHYLNITISKVNDEQREIIFEPYGDIYQKICEEFKINEDFSN